MADIVFERLEDGRILKHEGDYAIHQFVIQKRKKYEGLKSVNNICNRIDLLESDPRVRDKIMARFFSTPNCVSVFTRMWMMIPDERLFATLIREMKDHLTYLLFPMSPEFDSRGESEFGLWFGGALMRSVAAVPRGPSSYFQHDWFEIK